VKLELPVLVGWPVITAEFGDIRVNINPAGNTPAGTEKLYGAMPPVAVISRSYKIPLNPLGKLAGPKSIGAQLLIVST
jgi:hypothetical protein